MTQHLLMMTMMTMMTMMMTVALMMNEACSLFIFLNGMNQYQSLIGKSVPVKFVM